MAQVARTPVSDTPDFATLRNEMIDRAIYARGDGPLEIKSVLPAVPQSYEALCHESGQSSFFLILRQASLNTPKGLLNPRMERAIGVIYRPETELSSHYFQAVLSQQFDEYVWIDQTETITPWKRRSSKACPIPIHSACRDSR